MPFATLPAVKLYYELHGPDDAPPLLLLHGALETFRAGWQKQIEPFSRHYRLIGVDLRGHGQSNNPLNRLDLRQMADDLVDLLDVLGYESVHVCGFSGGASTALFLAHRHPQRVRSSIVISSNFELDRARADRDFWNVERTKRQRPDWWAQLAEIHTIDPAQIFQWWAEEDVIRPNFKPDELAQIETPTLVMGGDRDRIIPLAQTIGLYRHLPQARLAIFPNVGHGLPQRVPELFNRVALEFLEEMQV